MKNKSKPASRKDILKLFKDILKVVKKSLKVMRDEILASLKRTEKRLDDIHEGVTVSRIEIRKTHEYVLQKNKKYEERFKELERQVFEN